MVNIDIIKVGDKVHYQPEHFIKIKKWVNGIVKEIPEHTTTALRIVYNCNDDWENFKDYTSALTNVCDLFFGWK